MGVRKSAPDIVAFEGELADETLDPFEKALDVLRNSGVEVPTVDLTGVTFLSSRCVGVLVTLWVDLVEQGRWFELRASDKVWDLLGKAGVATVFFKRPGGAAARNP